MNDMPRPGRPRRAESQRRTLRFAQLVARDDTRLRAHAVECRLDPWRALDLLSDPQFRALVDGFCTSGQAEAA